MMWILIIALLPVAIYVVTWVFDNQEYRSGPLYWVASLLTIILLGLAMYMADLQKQEPIPTWFWPVAAGLVLLILALRRAMKWR
jgi:glucan phosphoethanolaminetransferase (alkaline phosphatase superfamily)